VQGPHPNSGAKRPKGSAVTTHLPQIAGETRRHQVVHVLRRAITNGQLQPGARLVEAELATQLGVSRGSVREALRQLEQEGLVVSYPYRATEVLGISQVEVEDMLVPIRLTLERFAFRHALPRLNADDLVRLEQLVATMQQAAAQHDLDQLVEADVRFHEYIIARSGQVHCRQLWQTIEPRVRAYFRRDAPAHPSPDAVVAQHAALLDALRVGEEATVLAALDEHIRTYLAPRGEHGA
jgi:DNA-binding GntR family transcriptional regulator